MNKLTIIFLMFLACTQTQIFSRAHNPTSHLTVICGSMASGKSDEFIRILRRIKVAHADDVLIVKHAWDNRKLAGSEKDPSKNIASRSGSSIECIAVNNVQEIVDLLQTHDYSVIGIDEAQFFNKEELLAFIRTMLSLKKTVIIAGLDLDFRGETFGAMGDLLARADEVVKLKAICSQCKEDRYCITQRIIDGEPAFYEDPIIMVGESTYEARCSDCHKVISGKRPCTQEISELNVSTKSL